MEDVKGAMGPGGPKGRTSNAALVRGAAGRGLSEDPQAGQTGHHGPCHVQKKSCSPDPAWEFMGWYARACDQLSQMTLAAMVPRKLHAVLLYRMAMARYCLSLAKKFSIKSLILCLNPIKSGKCSGRSPRTLSGLGSARLRLALRLCKAMLCFSLTRSSLGNV